MGDSNLIRALLVDDEPIMLDELINTPQWSNYQIEIIGTASNGIKALEFIKKNKVDVVFTDMKMPQMDGYELIGHIMKLNSNIICVVISSYGDYKLVRDAFNVGIIDYVLKEDIDSPEFENTLKKVLKYYYSINQLVISLIDDQKNIIDVSKVREYILERYQSNISLGKISQELNISEYTLSKKFIQQYGISFSKYLTATRIDAAKKLLKDTDYRMFEVCEMVGYSNFEHFCRVFKKETGYSPSEFKKI